MPEIHFTIPGDPVAKPRMTRRDVWAQRPAVLKYRAWCDTARAHVPTPLATSPACVTLEFYLPVPKSWAWKKREALRGQPCLSKPDIDNLVKSVLDALWDDDAAVYALSAIKRWDDGAGPRCEVRIQPEEFSRRG